MAAKFGRQDGQRKKVTLGLGAIGLLFLIFLYQFKDSFGDLWPGESQIVAMKDNLKRLHAQYQELLDKEQELDIKRERFHRRSKDFWIDSRDGNPKSVPLTKVEEAAQRADVQLNSSVVPRPSPVGDGAQIYAITVDTTAPMEAIANFLAEIYRISPLFYWQNVTLRPDNLREPQNVRFNGKLCFINCVDSRLCDFLLKESAGGTSGAEKPGGSAGLKSVASRPSPAGTDDDDNPPADTSARASDAAPAVSGPPAPSVGKAHSPARRFGLRRPGTTSPGPASVGPAAGRFSPSKYGKKAPIPLPPDAKGESSRENDGPPAPIQKTGKKISAPSPAVAPPKTSQKN